MSGRSLSKEEYQAEIKRVSNEWKNISPEMKEDYRVKAEHQQTLLDKLEGEPLPVQGAGMDASVEPEDGAWKNAAKKRSARRLEVNRQAFQAHNMWDLQTQFGDSPLDLSPASACRGQRHLTTVAQTDSWTA